jgi:hypothetical protein
VPGDLGIAPRTTWSWCTFLVVLDPDAFAQGGECQEQAEREALARRPASYRGPVVFINTGISRAPASLVDPAP